MSNKPVYDTIRGTVQSLLPGSRVLLFGSRAKENADPLSDYDLLVITSTALSGQQKVQMSTLLDHAIVKAIKAPVDLLLYSEEEVLQKRDLPGNIVRTALREGIPL